jgi:hypothetical protein
MSDWRRDALVAGFDIDALAFAADFVASGVVAIDGAPIEELPGYWVIPGFVPYDGRVILVTADRRVRHDDAGNVARELSTILVEVVAACGAANGASA